MDEAPGSVEEGGGEDFCGEGVAEAADAAKAFGFSEVVGVGLGSGEVGSEWGELGERAKVSINFGRGWCRASGSVLEGFWEHVSIPL